MGDRWQLADFTLPSVAEYGRFANAELARNALAELPAKVRKGSPWARRFADIQALIVDDPKKK